MRLVIELKRDAIPEVVLNKLYKHTSLQQTFGVNMVALADGVPRTLDLREVIRYYVLHQKEVVTRRTKDELERAERRAHILEGLLIALSNIDAVIKLIRSSTDPEQARAGLIEQFELSAEQAQAILDMRLQRLTALETDKIKSEHADLMERIKELRAILGEEERLYGLIKEELLEIKEIYGDERRSEIIAAEGEVDLEDMIAEEQMVISITRSGYIKRLPLSTYRKQQRGGVGVIGMETKEDDYIEHLRICSTHDFLLFFTTAGKVYRLKVYELPEGARTAKGRALVNLLPLTDGERVRARDPDARLLRAQVRRVRHAQRPHQEDRADGLQHADPRGRDHRDQAARRRPARRRARYERRGRHHHGVALRLRRALQRDAGAADGPRHVGRARHERLREGQRGARDGRRARRHRAVRRDGERVRQAHPDHRLPGEGPRHQGRQDDPDDRAQGRAGRRADRARAPGAGVHLAERAWCSARACAASRRWAAPRRA